MTSDPQTPKPESRPPATPPAPSTKLPTPTRLRPFIAALAADNPRRLAWVIAVEVTTALTQGIGLLLLVPLLEVAGVSRHADAGGIPGLARHVFGAVGLPLTLTTILVAYVVITAATAALSAYQTVLLARYRLEFTDGMRLSLYRAIARAEWRHLLGLRQSDLLTALTIDVSWVGGGTLAALNLGAALIVMAVQVAVALRISLAVTALATITGAALAALVWPLVGRSRRLGLELTVHNRGVLASMTGFLDGLKLAKAHGLESGHLSTFDTAITRARRSQVEFANASAIATAVQVSLTAVVLAVLVDVALIHLAIPLSELLVLAFIFTRLVPQITAAQSQIQTLAQALPAFEELTRVRDECDQAVEGSKEDGGLTRLPSAPNRQPLVLQDRLRFESVTFSYRRPDGQPAEVLHDVGFELPAGTTTALVGPSGAGKTTVADLALGLLCPTSGVVLIDGTALTGDAVARWRDAIAMVPQEAFLFHQSIRANLAWAQPEATESDMWQALAMAAAEPFVRQLPDGLDSVAGDRGGRLSGGERQRIALARALLRQPMLLVLDEATNSLDAANETAILDALAQLHGRLTMLVIAHHAATIRDADQVITIDGGTIAAIRRGDLKLSLPSNRTPSSSTPKTS
jgi:ATP-binding cassette subfamily C protein